MVMVKSNRIGPSGRRRRRAFATMIELSQRPEDRDGKADHGAEGNDDQDHNSGDARPTVLAHPEVIRLAPFGEGGFVTVLPFLKPLLFLRLSFLPFQHLR